MWHSMHPLVGSTGQVVPTFFDGVFCMGFVFDGRTATAYPRDRDHDRTRHFASLRAADVLPSVCGSWQVTQLRFPSLSE